MIYYYLHHVLLFIWVIGYGYGRHPPPCGVRHKLCHKFWYKSSNVCNLRTVFSFRCNLFAIRAQGHSIDLWMDRID